MITRPSPSFYTQCSLHTHHNNERLFIIVSHQTNLPCAQLVAPNLIDGARYQKMRINQPVSTHMLLMFWVNWRLVRDRLCWCCWIENFRIVSSELGCILWFVTYSVFWWKFWVVKSTSRHSGWLGTIFNELFTWIKLRTTTLSPDVFIISITWKSILTKIGYRLWQLHDWPLPLSFNCRSFLSTASIIYTWEAFEKELNFWVFCFWET